ncbi:hypothetical protein [Glycomyces salinus]|uniref:hypothetical protein n=1 Tax=Glycomyces salinus TaxID=980294 RepID=UPI0018EB38AD|nr:hypothetical protein [Glycomyces salinus]
MRDDLPDRLRSAGDDFEPDGDRMWERISEGMDGPTPVGARPVRGGFRVPHLAIATGAAVMLIAAIVVIGYRTSGEPSVPPTGPGQVTSSEPDGDEYSHEPIPEAVDEVESLDVQAGLDPDGSIDYWSQAELLLDVTEPVTELTVELRVAMRDDLRETGSWVTAEHYFDPAEVYEQDGYLVFRWTLIDGETIEEGQYTLAGQYNHGDGPRTTEYDYFELEAGAESGSGRIVGGIADR